MSTRFLSLIEESQSLNSKAFSLIRLLLLANLVKHKNDGILFRELQSGLEVTDGALYSNLKALSDMNYLKEIPVIVEEKDLSSYLITELGLDEWKRITDWLCRFLECMKGDNIE